MKNAQEDVSKFMEKAGQTVRTQPQTPEPQKIGLHLTLILEEFLETVEDAGFRLIQLKQGDFQLQPTEKPFNMKGVYDGLVDLNYVNLGAACACGLDMQQGHEEVHDSNMSKFIDGHRAENGKWIKGPSYRPADLGKLLPDEFK